MLSSVFAKSLFETRRGLFAWSVALLLINVWIVSIYPSIEDSMAFFDDYLQNLPDSMAVFIGEVQSLSTLEGYLSVELFNLVLPALVLAFTIAYGSGALGAEEQNRTLDLLLAHPLPRWRVYTEKFGAIVLFTAIVLVAGLLGIVLGSALIDRPLDAANAASATALLALITLVFGTLAMGLTGLGLGRGAAAGLAALVAAVTFLINSLAPLADLPEILQQITPWHYYRPDTVLTGGLEAGDAAALVALILVFTVVGLLGFRRRDIAI